MYEMVDGGCGINGVEWNNDKYDGWMLHGHYGFCMEDRYCGGNVGRSGGKDDWRLEEYKYSVMKGFIYL